MRRHKHPALLVSVVAAGLLVGWGGSDNESTGPQSNGVAQLEPDQILEKSKAAAKAASSVHLKGTARWSVPGPSRSTRSNPSAREGRSTGGC
jgi:hypothetical protein